MALILGSGIIIGEGINIGDYPALAQKKAIFGYGTTGAVTAITNLVSNTGVVATDTTGVGTARQFLAASSYGTNKAKFG